jgi:hypothetical protein
MLTTTGNVHSKLYNIEWVDSLRNHEAYSFLESISTTTKISRDFSSQGQSGNVKSPSISRKSCVDCFLLPLHIASIRHGEIVFIF